MTERIIVLYKTFDTMEGREDSHILPALLRRIAVEPEKRIGGSNETNYRTWKPRTGLCRNQT